MGSEHSQPLFILQEKSHHVVNNDTNTKPCTSLFVSVYSPVFFCFFLSSLSFTVLIKQYVTTGHCNVKSAQQARVRNSNFGPNQVEEQSFWTKSKFLKLGYQVKDYFLGPAEDNATKNSKQLSKSKDTNRDMWVSILYFYPIISVTFLI